MYDEVSAGAVLCRIKENTDIKYLILNYNYGHWDFPKGNIEQGETEIDTVHREISEETGITDLKILEGFREQISYRYRKKSKLVSKAVIYYLAETQSDKIILSFEHINYQWLDYEQSLKKLSFENSKNVLKLANQYLTDTHYIKQS